MNGGDVAGIHAAASGGDARLCGVHSARDGPAIAHLAIRVTLRALDLDFQDPGQFPDPAGFDAADISRGLIEALALDQEQGFTEDFRAWNPACVATEHAQLHLCVPEGVKAIEMFFERAAGAPEQPGGSEDL